MTIVLIVTVPRPRLLHRPGVPHVHFPPYAKHEALTILEMNPRPIHTSAGSPDERTEDDDEDAIWLWSRFCDVVWDTLAKGAVRDIVSFRSICEKLWPVFVAPIVEGTYTPRDFSRLLIAKRGIFQDESVLVDGVVPRVDNEEGKRGGGVMGWSFLYIPATPPPIYPFISRFLIYSTRFSPVESHDGVLTNNNS